MMIAPSGVMLKEIGSSSDMAATRPIPGSTPMSVPMNTPAKQNSIHLTGYTFGTAVLSNAQWRTWEEFLDYARANPGKIRYGTPGTGTTLHITMEQIALQEGIKWTQVPF